VCCRIVVLTKRFLTSVPGFVLRQSLMFESQFSSHDSSSCPSPSNATAAIWMIGRQVSRHLFQGWKYKMPQRLIASFIRLIQVARHSRRIDCRRSGSLGYSHQAT
jgi:hypothetical protein